jgi:phosphatidylinositol alpha-1,6-mannosyltransferase
MRVLYLTPGVFDKGGISRYNRYQITALREVLGSNKVTVASLLGPSRGDGDFETLFPVDWHGFYSTSSSKAMILFVLHTLRLGLIQRPNLIWAAHLNFSGLAWLLARIFGATTLVQVYGLEVWTPRPGRHDIRFGFQRSDWVGSDCHFTAQYIKETFQLSDEIAVIWDCVDTDRFSPGRPAPSILDHYGIPDPAYYFNILTLGRLSEDSVYKGYLRLLDLFPRLPSHTRLIYGGGGNLIPQLEIKAQPVSLTKRICPISIARLRSFA